MSDIVDTAAATIEIQTDAAISRVRGATFEVGQPGECDLCGYEFSRVVDRTYNGEPVKSCGGCRDLFALDK
ncbi:hypothetical protein [Stenotrophomonas phage BUCT627]|uniref:Uncharacterized protein n=2 Tax=Bixiavirus TaxID=3044676 RepID=A0A7D2LS98_9CAUD|nr:DksA-like zinc-finger protein [Stenotrophomonas phage vB_SmaS_BUCT548]YP_010677467.1 DksA-like zinc-finger protein [Stenotrophomonas phage BUCT627]QIQ60763.1 hypothetical protein [Stenotrophomonas phage vB_SmaS_BUCT548]QYC96667.1 hypothetical protein [Stenotrophomonas phage BUCT627]WFG37978.1 DksA-like zinc-finger protein [Pseudomonas phage 20Sep420]